MADPILISRRLLAACAVAPTAALGLSLVLQHGFGIEPCVWCVLQRAIYVLIILVCSLGAATRSRGAVIVATLFGAVLSGLGLWTALYHNYVAAVQPQGCGVSLADKLLMITSLHEYVPWLFFPSAPCDQANAPLLGIPFAIWSATLFAMLGVGTTLAAYVLLRSPRAGARA